MKGLAINEMRDYVPAGRLGRVCLANLADG